MESAYYLGGHQDYRFNTGVLLPSGGLLLAGYTITTTPGAKEMILAKFHNQGGKVDWIKTYGDNLIQ